jgi:hypothetical protein
MPKKYTEEYYKTQATKALKSANAHGKSSQRYINETKPKRATHNSSNLQNDAALNKAIKAEQEGFQKVGDYKKYEKLAKEAKKYKPGGSGYIATKSHFRVGQTLEKDPNPATKKTKLSIKMKATKGRGHAGKKHN